MVRKHMMIAVLAMAFLVLPGTVFAEGAQERKTPAANYRISVSATGTAVSTKTDAPAFVDAGLAGWTLQNLSAAGVDFYIFRLAPGAAEYPVHGSPVAWMGYILKGSGKLLLGASDNSVASTVEYAQGDFLIFDPNTLHGWQGGPTETDILFLTPKATQ